MSKIKNTLTALAVLFLGVTGIAGPIGVIISVVFYGAIAITMFYNQIFG